MKPGSRLAMFLAAVVAWMPRPAEGARADPGVHTVVLLRPAVSDDVTAEATARVRGELKAAGFEVLILQLDPDEAKRDLDTAGSEYKPIAAFAILVTPSEGGGVLAEIWVSDRIRRKTFIQHAILNETDHVRDAAVLAVRAVELLKARLSDFWVPSTPDSAPPVAAPIALRPAVARESTSDERPAFGAGFAVALGIGVLDGFGALGTTWAPLAAVGYGWDDGFGVRARFDGLGPAGVLTLPAGSARIEQHLATAELVKTWWPRAAVVPIASVGLGAQHLHVAGTSSVPLGQGHTSDQWSLLTTLGAGVGIPVLPAVSLVAEARVVAAWPPSTIQITGDDAGRVGTPSLLFDAALLGVLR